MLKKTYSIKSEDRKKRENREKYRQKKQVEKQA